MIQTWVRIVSEPLAMSTLRCLNGATAQVVRMLAGGGGCEREHVVANLYPVKPEQSVCLVLAAELQAQFPSAVISVLLNDGPGESAVFCGDDSGQNLFSAAVAFAALKKSWGWDESAFFRLEVNGTVFTAGCLENQGDGLHRFTVS